MTNWKFRYYGRMSGATITAMGRICTDIASPDSPGEQGWNVDKGAWVTGNSIQSALGSGGADWDDITENEARQFAPAAFREHAVKA